MNEEEKKTIEKFIEKCYKYDESVEIKGISVGEEYRMLNTVCKALNLIEKLQKENEELKFEERRRIIGKYGDAEIHDVINRTLSNDYIPKQKLKDIIDRIDYDIKKTKAIISNNSNIYTSDRRNDYQRVRLKAMNTKSLDIKKRLQELLEKEE